MKRFTLSLLVVVLLGGTDRLAARSALCFMAVATFFNLAECRVHLARPGGHFGTHCQLISEISTPPRPNLTFTLLAR